jgi:hypothetical protein
MFNLKGLFIIVFLFIITTIQAQDISGLWKGVLHNDTTGKDLAYELAISKNGKKLTGFSYTFFIVNDKVYHGLKKVKIKKVDDKYLIEDDDLVANNYPFAPPKGTKQMNVLTLQIMDSIMQLSGPFKTQRTKEYKSLSGNVTVQRKNDFYKQSALLPHLQELGLANDLSFVKEEEEKINSLAAAENSKAEAIANKNKLVVVPPIQIMSNATPAANFSNRKIETIQSVYFKSDSLEITLYDNGEVDGDTVSVILNGNIIMPKVGLSTNAVRKKISTTNLGDSIQLVMYAETLGSLPPNTGLLIVYDGTQRYEIRFSGDMQKSSAIVFRRKSPL